MEEIIRDLKNQINVRSRLSELRKFIRESADEKTVAGILEGDDALLAGFLQSEDAKTRKNAALLIGDLKRQTLSDRLWQAYMSEQTRFVKSAYLQAMQQLDVSEKVPGLRDRLEELKAEELTDENRKHVEEETREIRRILIRYEGITKHKFAPLGKTSEVLLLTNRNLRENICRSVSEGEASVHPLGVLVKTSDFTSVSKMRTYRELVFPVHAGGMLPMDPQKAADLLWASDLYQLLSDLHLGDETWYYRIELKNVADPDTRMEFCRKLAAVLDRLSGGKLVNSPSEYEAEIRLIASKDGSLFPCLKLYTYKDTRFSYRKNAIASSIHPSTAALIAETAKPYLKEKAQVIDPFAGVGTMLIERNRLVPAGDMYATDIFGDAVRLGRENAEAAKVRINFIQRDFMAFHHEYVFDEIITDMPVRGKKTREEMDRLYGDFFNKMPEILAPQAIVILYTNESGFVHKQLRLHKQFSLLQETNMQKATQTRPGFDLIICRYEAAQE